MRVRNIVQYVSPQRAFDDTIQILSIAYHPVLVKNSSMMVTVANINLGGVNTAQPFSYVMSDNDGGSFRHLTNGIYTKLNVADPENWTAQESVPSTVSDVVAMPNPFVVRGSSVLKFRLPPIGSFVNGIHPATLTIFSTSMDKIFSGEVAVTDPAEPFVEWNGQDDQFRTVSSGIYFYQITVDDKQYLGKFAVIRE
jgi:hypothetical protein